jgi:hypothetical protein
MKQEAARLHKRPLSLPKLRTVLRQFSWGDQRLVRERSIEQLSHEACTLSLFLVTVADAHGLSFSSERSRCHRLSMDHLTLPRARQALIPLGLVASATPLSQVLALDKHPLAPVPQTPRLAAANTPMALKDMFKRITETRS